MQGSSIIVNQVSLKRQGIDILKNISFSLQAGEHLAIIGHSGSGKTTFAKAIARQLHTQGSITIVWDESLSLQKKVVLVEQRNQFKNLSHTSDFYYQQRFNSFDAGDSETVWQALINFDTRHNIETINSVLKNAGLWERRNAPLIQLSSGENKRFQLSKAILLQPQILILDSPFTGLDAEARQHLNIILSNLALSGTQIIIITDWRQIPDCITHIATLEQGELKSYTAREDQNSNSHFNLSKHTWIDVDSLPVAKSDAHYRYIIDMRNVSVQHGDKSILNNINWQVQPGEKWLLKGPNGAGKSTLLSLTNGDNPQAYKNEMYLFDKRRGSGESIWDIKSKIGYVSPELHAFYDKATNCYDAIASGFFDTIGLFRKLSVHQAEQVDLWMKVLNLQTFRNRPLSVVSFSTQRLVLLARALVKKPVLLILDEPCQGLDDGQRDEFVSFINLISEHDNKTLIYVSHFENEIPDCITHVMQLTNDNQKKYVLEKQTAFA